MKSLIIFCVLVFLTKIHCNNYLNCTVKIKSTAINCYGDNYPQILSSHFLDNVNINEFDNYNKTTISFNNSLLINIDIDWSSNLIKTGHNWIFVNFGFNRLSILELGIFNQLKNLSILALNNNKLQFLSVGLFDQNTELFILKLSFNELVKLKVGIFDQLKKLDSLYLNNNKLETIELGIFNETKNLKNINLSYNRLIQLESIFSHTRKLFEINLSNNPISIINSEIFNGQNSLTWLYLNDCNLKEINENLFHGLNGLIELHLNGNFIRELPQNIFNNLNDIERIYLQKNYLEVIPNKTFSYLKNLLLLDISQNRLNEIPNIDNETNKLKVLNLNQNEIENIELNQLLHFDSLKYLNLGYNKLTFLDTKVLQNFNNIQRLDTVGNPFTCPCWDEIIAFRQGHYQDNNFKNNLFKLKERRICFNVDTLNCIQNIDNNRYLSKSYLQERINLGIGNEIYFTESDIMKLLYSNEETDENFVQLLQAASSINRRYLPT